MINEKDVFIGCTYRHNESWCGKRTDDLDTKEFDIKWSPSDWYLVGECLLFLDDISGIPLTPEIMVNLGFNGKYKNCGYSFQKDGLWLSSQDEDDYGNPIEDYVFHVHLNHGYEGFYFVHEIQNLYQLLIKKELIYNPKP